MSEDGFIKCTPGNLHLRKRCHECHAWTGKEAPYCWYCGSSSFIEKGASGHDPRKSNKIGAQKLRKLRLTDVGGRKEHPADTVKSALMRGLGGLYDDAAVDYILRHGVKYYQDAIKS